MPEYEYVLRLVYGVTGNVSELYIKEKQIDRHWEIVEDAQRRSSGEYFTEAKILRRPKLEWETVREL